MSESDDTEHQDVLTFIATMHRKVADIVFADMPDYWSMPDDGKQEVAECHAENTNRLLRVFDKYKAKP